MQWSDVLLAAVTPPWLVTRPWQRIPRALLAPLAMWLVLGATTALTRGGMTKLLGSVMLAVLMLMTADFARDPAWRSRAAAATVASAVVMAACGLLAVAMFYSGLATPLLTHYGDLVPGSYPRARSLTTHHNMLGSYAIFAAAMSFALPARWRAAGIAAALVSAVLAISRGLLGVAVVVAWFRDRRVRWAGLAVAALVITSLTVFDLRLNPARPWDTTLDTSGGGRREEALSAMATALDEPVFGCGLDCLPARWRGAAWDAHNTPIQVAATRGLPGLAAFVWLVWCARPRSWTSPAAAALVALLLDGMAQDVEDFRHLWVALGLAASSSAVDAERDEQAT